MSLSVGVSFTPNTPPQWDCHCQAVRWSGQPPSGTHQPSWQTSQQRYGPLRSLNLSWRQGRRNAWTFLHHHAREVRGTGRGGKRVRNPPNGRPLRLGLTESPVKKPAFNMWDAWKRNEKEVAAPAHQCITRTEKREILVGLGIPGRI